MERESRERSLFRRIPGIATLLIGWTAFPIILVGIVLMELGFPSWLAGDAAVYLLVVAALVFALFHTVLDQHGILLTSVSAQTGEIRSLNQLIAEGESLLKMEAAILEIEERLRAANTRETVIIEHFGLDMTVAWNSVETLIKRLTFVRNLHYRILILASDEDEEYLPENVQEWLALGRAKVDSIVERARQLELLFERSNRKLKCEIKEYCDLPIIHGIRIVHPIQIAFVSFCRWGEDEYEWGRDDYRRVAASLCSESQRDIEEIFGGNFNHYWSLSAVSTH